MPTGGVVRKQPGTTQQRVTARRVTAFRLRRLHLDRRAPRSGMAEVVGDMCAVHAQLMSSVELALWARVAGLDRRAVQRALWEERTLAKTWCMRGTLHVMRADDLPLYQAARGVGRYRSAAWLRYFDLAPSDIDRIADAVGTALDGRMLTRKELADEVARLSGRELRQRLLSGWGALLKPAAYLGRLCFGPPQGQEVTFVRPDQWLGRWTAWTEEGARQEVLRRYLRTYGPATRDDFEWWLGIPPREAKPPWAAVEPELAAVEVDGRPAWVLAGTRLPTGGPRPGVRLLPGFDGYVLGHRTRSHLVDEAFRGRVYRPQGWVSPTVLVNGRIEGVWSHRRIGERLRVTVEAFTPLPTAAQQAIEAEAASLATFMGGELDIFLR